MSLVEQAKQRLDRALTRLETAAQSRLHADSISSEQLALAQQHLAEAQAMNQEVTARYDRLRAKTIQLRAGLDESIEKVTRDIAEQG